jgi:hypothetical protein
MMFVVESPMRYAACVSSGARPTCISIGTKIGASSAHFAEADPISRLTRRHQDDADDGDLARHRERLQERRALERDSAPMFDSAERVGEQRREERHHDVVAHRAHRLRHALDDVATSSPCRRR